MTESRLNAESVHRDTVGRLSSDLKEAANQVARLTMQCENTQAKETEVKETLTQIRTELGQLIATRDNQAKNLSSLKTEIAGLI